MFQLGLKFLIFIYVLATLLLATSAVSSAGSYEFSFESPLIDATDQGNRHEVVRLLQGGVSVNSRGAFGTTALMRAAYRGNYELASILLEKGADVNVRDIGGATALHIATRQGHNNIVELLLKHRADPESLDSEGFSPLGRAVNLSKYHAVEILLAQGADPASKDGQGLAPVDYAYRTKNQSIIKVIEHKLAQIRAARAHIIPSVSQGVGLPSSSNKGFWIKREDSEGPTSTSVLTVQDLSAKLTSTNPKDPLVSSSEVVKSLLYDSDTEKVLRHKDPLPDAALTTVPHLAPKIKAEDMSYHSSEVQDFANRIQNTITKKDSLISEEGGQVSVSEAIKLPDDLPLDSPMAVIRKPIEEDHYSPVQAISRAPSAPLRLGLAKGVREIWMELSGFSTEAEAIELWQKIVDHEAFSHLGATLLVDKEVEYYKPALRVGKYEHTMEVFQACKDIKLIASNVLCYSVHNVY
jgi:hypothetical protein